ncbi:MAG: hypothetical protein GEU80_06550 [Dehalococcoidia bacterium]|nr:hypothetical protein [Dehalococcoidia bacterium]
MDLLHLVDRLEEQVAGAQKMPIGNRAIVDRRRMLDIIDQMRIAVPREVRDAQDIVARQDSVMREAEEEARMVVARAEERATRLVEEHELTQSARRRAEEIAVHTEARLEERIQQANQDIGERLEDSRRLAQQQMRAADEYARELLNRLERQLQAFVRSVQSGIDQLEDDREAPPFGLAAYEDDAPDPANEAYDAASRATGEAAFDDDADADGGDWDGEPDDPDEHPVGASMRAAPLSGQSAGVGGSYDGASGWADAEAPRGGLPERQPLPLRRDPPAGSSAQAPLESASHDLDNLLQRRPSTVQPAAIEDEAPVIDDFDRPPLDDDPTLEKDRDED